MHIEKIWLKDFRNYSEKSFEFGQGFTAVVGKNGIGKTNLIEAISYLGSFKSFRGSPTESLINQNKKVCYIRANFFAHSRELLIESEIKKGKTIVQVNKQKTINKSEILSRIKVIVFSPSDLFLVQQGPAIRRNFLDDLLVSIDPNKYQLIQKYEKILKQRNSLLKQSKSLKDENLVSTIEVWDKRISHYGEQLVELRIKLISDLVDLVQDIYTKISRKDSNISLKYEKSWGNDLYEELIEVREYDLRRSVTSLGPHRDDFSIELNGLKARTESSQGEQRTLALAFKLASKKLIESYFKEPPILLLDDVLSELDTNRSVALLEEIQGSQVIVTSAVPLPEDFKVSNVLELDEGKQSDDIFS